MLRKISIVGVAGLLILLFMYITVSKMLDYNSFRHALKVSPLIGEKFTIVSVVLLISMIWASVLLCTPSTRLWGLYVSAAFLLIVIIYMGYVIYFTARFDYPFSGIKSPRFGFFGMTWMQFFVFNIIFFLLSLTGIFVQRRGAIMRRKEKELPPVVFT